jgi:hypothetical protein
MIELGWRWDLKDPKTQEILEVIQLQHGVHHLMQTVNRLVVFTA